MNARWLNKAYFRGLFLIFLSCFQPKLAAIPSPEKMQPLLLDVYINQRHVDQLLYCFIDETRQIWVTQSNIEQWLLPLPADDPLVQNGQKYYMLNTITAIDYRFEPSSLALFLEIPLQYLPLTTIGSNAAWVSPIRPKDHGVFLNYDLSVQNCNFISDNYSSYLFTELGVFNPYGVGLSDFLVQYANNQLDPIRLESTWIIDQPENMTTWRIGDSITTNVPWSGAVRFGGIKWGTNFSTQPYFSTLPLPRFSGTAVVPSTLNLFINNALRLSQDIGAGPFMIDNIPVVTGAGTIKVMTQNPMGRQEEFILPYYASEQLLKAGLISHSYELGFIRNDFGINSFNYSNLVGVGTYRKGFSDNWSAGWHGEFLVKKQAFGLASDYLWNNYFVISSAVAASHSTLGAGAMGLLGVQRQSERWSYGAQAIGATQAFTELGLASGQSTPSLRLQSFITYSAPRLGTFGLSYTQVNNSKQPCDPFDQILDPDTLEQEDFDQGEGPQFYPFLNFPSTKLLTLYYSRNIIKNLYFTLNSIFDLVNHQNTQVGAFLIWSLGSDKSLMASSTRQSENNQQTLLLSKNLPLGEGYGYRFLAAQGDLNQAQGYLAYQNKTGTYSATLTQTEGTTNYAAQVSGGLSFFDKQFLLSREVYNSFTLVKVPGFENICVYDRNVCIGRTDKSGTLLVPNSLPYQRNRIAIEPTDFPLNTEINNTVLEVMPYYRSGVLAKFDVKTVHNVIMTLLQESGVPVPSGATVRIQDSTLTYPVGENGVFFAASTQSLLIGDASWEAEHCQFQVKIPTGNKILMQLGEVSCYSGK